MQMPTLIIQLTLQQYCATLALVALCRIFEHDTDYDLKEARERLQALLLGGENIKGSQAPYTERQQP